MLTLVILASALATLIGGRQTIVRTWPQTASLYGAVGFPVNLRGLALTRVGVDANGGDAALTIRGEIVSRTGVPVELPELRFTMRDSNGREVATWTAAAPQARLGPHERVAFMSPLPPRSPEVRDVTVRFASGQASLSH